MRWEVDFRRDILTLRSRVILWNFRFRMRYVAACGGEVKLHFCFLDYNETAMPHWLDRFRVVQPHRESLRPNVRKSKAS